MLRVRQVAERLSETQKREAEERGAESPSRQRGRLSGSGASFPQDAKQARARASPPTTPAAAFACLSGAPACLGQGKLLPVISHRPPPTR